MALQPYSALLVIAFLVAGCAPREMVARYGDGDLAPPVPIDAANGTGQTPSPYPGPIFPAAGPYPGLAGQAPLFPAQGPMSPTAPQSFGAGNSPFPPLPTPAGASGPSARSHLPNAGPTPAIQPTR